MKNQPLVSVVVPIYNVQDYLNQCVNSIVNQSYKNLEIILVDDGALDDCPKICDEWEKKDSRIIVIHKRNGGLSDARNVGIDKASGKYIGFVDSDDYIDRNMYELMVETAEKHDADIVTCGRFVFEENGKKHEAHSCQEQVQLSSEEAVSSILRGSIVEEAAWDKLYRITLFEGIRYPVGEINEDIVTTPLLINRANKVIHVGKSLYYYRFVNTGITKSGYKPSKRVVIKHIKWVRNYIKKNYPHLMKEMYVLQGRYCYSVFRSFFLVKGLRITYRKDYKIFKKLLIEAVLKIFFSRGFSIRQRLYYVLVVINAHGRLFDLLASKNTINNQYKKV